MKIEALQMFYWAVMGRHVDPGEVIDVDDELGQDLIDQGYAKPKRKRGRPPKDKAARATEDK